MLLVTVCFIVVPLLCGRGGWTWGWCLGGRHSNTWTMPPALLTLKHLRYIRLLNPQNSVIQVLLSLICCRRT
jgi:hypothetical protein